ncbi:MAG: hypothetical protein Q7S40_29795, partial [Opitutaceae bacterium]|nr:hypothetical protein [Opitutaceae bacterium]
MSRFFAFPVQTGLFVAVLCTPLQAQTVVSGTQSAVTIPGDISISASTSATFTGGTTFTGANATLGTNAVLNWQQVVTLASKAFTFGSGAYVYLNSVNAAFTIDPTSTLTGDIRILADGSTGTVLTNQGTINHTHASSGQLYARTFNNSGLITATAGTLEIGSTSAGYNTFNTGTITANGAAAIVEINGNVANTGSGILRAENSGTLHFGGTNTTANLGTVQIATGGHARIQGTITNTAATLPAPTGGSYELYGGTILNGSVASNALTFTSSGGTLNGATLLGTVNIPANTHSNIASTSGPAGMTGASVTWGNNAYFYLSNVNAAFTIDPTSTLTGDIRILADGSTGTVLTNQGAINHTHASSGQLYARTFNNSGPITATAGTLEIGSTSAGYNTFNTGTITANGAAAIVEINGNVANTGTGILRAENFGTLHFGGTNTTANLGTVQIATGGHARIQGTITNTAATLPAPTGGSYELYGGTILNGSVASNALTFTSSGGTLNGATLLGTVNIPA